MIARRYSIEVATLCVLGCASASSAAKDSHVMRLPFPASMNGREIPAGEYRVSWKAHSPEVTIAFTKGRQVIVTLEGRWVDRPRRYTLNAVVYDLRPDGSRRIVEIRFAGLTRALVIDGPDTGEQNKLVVRHRRHRGHLTAQLQAPGSKTATVKIAFVGKPSIAGRQAQPGSVDEFWLEETLQSQRRPSPARR